MASGAARTGVRARVPVARSRTALFLKRSLAPHWRVELCDAEFTALRTDRGLAELAPPFVDQRR
jgi:hypothetical protein